MYPLLAPCRIRLEAASEYLDYHLKRRWHELLGEQLHRNLYFDRLPQGRSASVIEPHERVN
jgi:hypothetical protein